ncbi:hypothetical protein BEN71_12650 [Acinetobacter wuhouensis]|uniref:hypothetical protein n=1 Tax=Acinetobacter wuhouensis TaxID=1879050 RepID=UPI00083A0286|nr:hypothetical protein [Acinetobacter wuhouensis]AXQ22869.1 hypothetical protein BEN71_12650 [Acinetobacter wuhouensis]
MIEIIMTLFATFFTIKGKPYLTFIVRTLVLSIFLIVGLTISKVWGNTLNEYLDSLNWMFGVSFGMGVILSLFIELVNYGGTENK